MKSFKSSFEGESTWIEVNWGWIEPEVNLYKNLTSMHATETFCKFIYLSLLIQNARKNT